MARELLILMIQRIYQVRFASAISTLETGKSRAVLMEVLVCEVAYSDGRME